MKKIIYILLVFIVSISSVFPKTDKPNSDEFLNPVLSKEQGPDPFVYKYADGYYYGMHTVMDANGYTHKVVLYKNKP